MKKLLKVKLLKKLLNKPFLLTLLIIPVLGCNRGGDNSLQAKEKEEHFVISDEMEARLEEGDVIVRQGRGAFSEKIVEFMDEPNPFSHCGIVAKVNGKKMIIHSVSEEMSGRDGVQTQSIKAFSSDVADSAFAIVRPKIPVEERQRIAEICRYYLEKEVPFDYDYNTDDSAKLYCIELAYYSVGTVMGKDVFDTKDYGDVYLVLFQTFFKPEYFELLFTLREIKY